MMDSDATRRGVGAAGEPDRREASVNSPGPARLSEDYVPVDGLSFAYVDPPYLGCCKLYKHFHGEDGLCWDEPATHRKLIDRIEDEFDGWALSLSVKSLPTILSFCPDDVLTLAWFKPIAPPLGDHRRYNWEPVIVRPLRRYGPGYVPIAVVASPPMYTFRETPETHVIGEKPEAFVHWVLASAGVNRQDDLTDVFVGSGAISRAWETYNPGPTVPDGYAESKRARCDQLEGIA